MSDCLSMRDRYFVGDGGRASDPVWLRHLASCDECRRAQDGLPTLDHALAEIASLPLSPPPYDTVAFAVKRAARRQRRRQVMRQTLPFVYTGFAAAAVAASIVALVWVGRVRSTAPKLLAPGAELAASTEAKTVRLGNGTRVRLDAGWLKLASVTPAAQTLELPSGRVLLEVPRLPSGSSLVVRTPDAEVRVHGTRFQVSRTTTNTEVTVMEGLVEVRPEGVGRPVQFLRAGQTATVTAAGAYREQLRDETLHALDRGEFAAAEKRIDDLIADAADRSQQAEAQALLAWSLAARGKLDQAIARYRQALALLPPAQKSLWAENACAELALLVEQKNPSDAKSTWAECLRRFPDGLHAGLARARASGKGR